MTPPLPLTTRAEIFTRFLAIQASWNYETLVGNGIGFTIEPALRLLPGGQGGDAYRRALARQSQYFNAHPYMAALAVGALARAELDGEDPTRIERFRTALCGPLGATGDRLVWAAWLPMSMMLGLLAFGVGLGPMATVLTFLLIYNAGHLGLRLWGLTVGYRQGMQVAKALGIPLFRTGPQWVSRAGSLVAGLAIPLALARAFEGTAMPRADGWGMVVVLAVVGVGGAAVSRLHGRYDVWKWASGLLALVALASMVLAWSNAR